MIAPSFGYNLVGSTIADIKSFFRKAERLSGAKFVFARLEATVASIQDLSSLEKLDCPSRIPASQHIGRVSVSVNNNLHIKRVFSISIEDMKDPKFLE